MRKTLKQRYDERNHQSGKVITPGYEEADVVTNKGQVRCLIENDSIDVNLQDQITPTVIVPLNEVTNTTTTSVATTKDTWSFTVANTTGFIDKAFLTITNVEENRFYIAHQIGVPVDNVISVDRPLDFAFPLGSSCTAGSHAINVDGSSDPRIFSLKAADPGIPFVVDITRILFQSICSSAADLSLFGNLTALTKGITLRKTGAESYNIFTAKTNANMKGIMFDFDLFDATNPAQGIDGFGGRFTVAGQNKLGVAIRLGPGDDLELVQPENLSGLTTFMAIAEGHVVVD